MQVAPASTRFSLFALGLGIATMMGVAAYNHVNGSTTERVLTNQIATADASLSNSQVSCMANHAAQTVALRSIHQPGAPRDAAQIEASAVAAARVACVG